MEVISNFFKGFFYIQRNIKAKIFVNFTIATLLIIMFVTFYWYNMTVQLELSTIMENMRKNVDSSIEQIDNGFQDVTRMHAILTYESSSLYYILKNDYNQPDELWFGQYYQVLKSLQTMNTNLTRIITGIGIFKNSGETCISGILSLSGDIIHADWYKVLESTRGNDVIFFQPKPGNVDGNQVLKYIFVGRAVTTQQTTRAVIATKINSGLLVSALNSSIFGKGFVMMADDKGSIIFDSSPDDHIELKKSIADQIIINPDIKKTNEFMYITKKSEMTGWTVVSAVPYSYVDKISKRMTTQFILTILVALLTVAAISMFVSNKITYRLHCLNDNMQRVSSGSLDTFTKLDTNDEVGQLSESFVNMIAHIRQLMQSIKDNEKHKREMEIKVLRSQVSPHFLYNSLNTINYLAKLQKSSNIQILTQSLIELLQGAVEIDDRLVPVADEIRYVNSYLNIQQYKYPQGIKVDIQVSDEVRQYKVPRMILQPIVENSLIHGVSDLKIGGSIRITAYDDGGNLNFNITDNGVGMSEEKIKEVMNSQMNKNNMRFSGIGLNNVDARIKMQLGQEYGISIYSQLGVFTTVKIILPIVEGNIDD